MRKIKKLLTTFVVTTTLTAVALTGCGKSEELVADVSVEDTAKDIIEDTTDTDVETDVLADTEKEENRETGTVQSKENIEAETDVEQAYDDFLEEQTSDKLEEKAEFTVVPFQTTFYVSSDTNVYEKPDNTSTVVGKVTYNTEIVTTGKVQEVDWYKFKLDGKDAYVSQSFLSDKKMELEVVKEKEPEKTKEEYQQAANNFKEQVKQEQANTTNPFAGGFNVTGSGENWEEMTQNLPDPWAGKDVTIH